MPKAIPCRRRPVPDADHHYRVWKITDWDTSHCVLGYLTFKLFSPDGRYLFFASNRTGEFQLYRLDLEREEAVQVTGAAGLAPVDGIPIEGQWRDCNVHRQRNEFVYCTDRRIIAADIETFKPRVVAECPPDWSRIDATPLFSGDGKLFATDYELPDGRRGVAVGEMGDKPAKLTTVMVGKPGEGVGYLISSPTERFILSVCVGEDRQNIPTESYANRARAWRIDPATGECRPYLVVPPGFRATHQYFGPGGRLYFHKKTVPTWTPTWVASIDLDGGDYRDHYGSPDRKLGHSCVSADGSYLVIDVQESNRNELIHLDLKTGESRIIWWPNSSCTADNSQAGHVHPSADFQGRRVAFQSDQSGKCALYLAEIGE